MAEKSIFGFSAVEAQHASPKTVREIIKSILKADNDKCADEILQYMMPPGRMGSREYDHCQVVLTVLNYDENGILKAAMEAENMSPRLLWDQIVKVYRAAGFRMKHGRIIGILEADEREKLEQTNGSEDGIE